LDGSGALVIHVGTNDVRRSRNLDYVTGEVYDLVNTAKAKFPDSRLVLRSVLRSRSVSWRRVEAANDRLEWVARTLGATFVDPNSWIRDENFGRACFTSTEVERVNLVKSTPEFVNEATNVSR
jgi:hypothetical protein